MPCCRSSRWLALACLLFLLCLVSAVPLSSQTLDTVAASTQYVVDGDLVNSLPVDRAIDALTFLPGVTTDNSGELLLRAGHAGDAAWYLDGVPILSGFRSTPFFGLSISHNLESRTSLAPNLVDSVGAITGPLPAELGNGQSGALSIRTRLPR